MGSDPSYWYSLASYRSYIGALVYVLIRAVISKKYQRPKDFIRGLIIQCIFLQTSSSLYSGLSALLWYISVNLARLLLKEKVKTKPCPLSTTLYELEAYTSELYQVD